MKIVMGLALFALCFSTGFTCAKNKPAEEAVPAAVEAPPQAEPAMAPTDAAPADGSTMAPADGAAQDSTQPATESH